MENNHIVSFIGFAPADDPSIVVYVAVDNLKGTIQFGGYQVAAPIVGHIMRDSLPEMGVKKRKGQIEKEVSVADTKTIEVPNLVGGSVSDLESLLINLKIDASGTGSKVVKQSPVMGTKVKEGSTIRLYLNDE
ncbi:PASTA domain-containing protein [Bacillus sp. SL00103]